MFPLGLISMGSIVAHTLNNVHSIHSYILSLSYEYCFEKQVHANEPNLPLIVEFMETYSYFETPTIKIHAEKGAYYFETLKAALTWVMELEEPEARKSLAVD